MDNDFFISIAQQFYQQILDIQSCLVRSNGYAARYEMLELISKCSNDSRRLEQYGYKVYSQNDEDGIISEICKRLSIAKGTFVEIGVENGLECNSHYLLHQGWSGIWIEADTSKQGEIFSRFGELIDSDVLKVCFQRATSDNFEKIITDASGKEFLENIDFLSIDIDGMDVYLLENLKFRPKIICIEYNAKFPPMLKRKPVYNSDHVWDGSDYMGSSLSTIDNVAQTLGYSLVATNITGANAFFVRNDCLTNDFLPLMDITTLYNPPRYWLTRDHFASQVGHRSNHGKYINE